MATITRKQTEDGTLFQAHNEAGKTVGLGQASITPDGELSLDSLFINPGERGKGHGSNLLNEMIKWGQEQEATELTGEFKPLDENAGDFYKKRNIELTPEGRLRGRFTR